MNIVHHRTEITITKIQSACPYCKKRLLIRKTCGYPECQWKHKIFEMRKFRKTDQVRPTARYNI